MAALTFIDTNVIAYAYDSDAGAKCERARDLLREIDGAVISTQVLMELYAVLTGKLGVVDEVALGAVDALLGLEVVATDAGLVREGLRLAVDNDLSPRDALIIAAASRAGCDVLLTEELKDGQVFEGVRVVNPFTD